MEANSGEFDSVDQTTILDEDDIHEVMEAISDLAARYYEFGGALGVRATDLDQITLDNSECSMKLRHTVLKCLRQQYSVEKFGKPTWKKFVLAADKYNHALAVRIAKKHSASHEHGAIHLTCDVYQVNSKQQIECSTDEESRNTSDRDRDIIIKLKDKKFNSVPPCTPIFLKVSASKTCYVYIINIGSTGNMTTLFPNDCESENCLQAGEYLQFPSPKAGYTFELDANSGKETIIVLAYDRALSKVDQAEQDCANLIKQERARDIKIVKNHQLPRGFLRVNFSVTF